MAMRQRAITFLASMVFIMGSSGAGGYVAMAWMSRQNEVVQGQVIMGQFWNICGIFCNGFE